MNVGTRKALERAERAEERALALRSKLARSNARRDELKAYIERLKARQRELDHRARIRRDELKAYIERLKARQRELDHRARIHRYQVEQTPRYRYGSLSEGLPEWEVKWDRTAGRRVLIFDPAGACGLGMRLGAALNEFTEYAARHVRYRRPAFGYPPDLHLPLPGVLDSDLERLVDECDVVHLIDEAFFIDEYLPVNKVLKEPWDEVRALIKGSGRPLVFSLVGSISRAYQHNETYRQHVMSCAGRISFEGDLAFAWAQPHLLPYTIDCRRLPYLWTDGQVVGHSPSTPARKGTEELTAAMAGLDGLELDIIHGVSHDECMARKRRCSLFFDQAGREFSKQMGVEDVIGWWGNSAVESAVHGIPAHLSSSALENAWRFGPDLMADCQIINVPMDVDGIREEIARLFAMSSGEREALSRRTRRWIEDTHDYPVVGANLGEIYQQSSVRVRPPVVG